MKKYFGLVLLIALAGLLFAVPLPKYEPLPAPLSNNAVASVKTRGSLLLFSLMGMGPKKTWDSTSNAAYSLDTYNGKWAEVHSVPGTVGRLAAAAMGAREHIFLFGCYVVDGQGVETTLADVNVYEPLTDRWFRGEDMPVPVDDSVAGVYRDRYIYLVSGWSKTDAVRDVQVYDGQKCLVEGHPYRHAGVRSLWSVGGQHDCVYRRGPQEPSGRSAEVRGFGRMLDGQD
jgi:hypothetical protein